ncbi:MAG: hypothetical protein LBV12_05220 [Puniceicoccales bacterium]|jgi:hypothetical protein|nr:hypothetical protein [Puniceicoccales bacterium]
MQQNTPLSQKTARIWLVVADLIAVVAIIVLFGLTSAGDIATIAAVAGVIAAGLFIILPVLRETPAKNAIGSSDEIKTLHDSIRSLAENFAKRQTALEKQILAHSATPANFPALGEIADKIADLSTINSEDGDLPRIRTSLEEIQAQLDLLSEAVRTVEGKLEKQITLASMPSATEGDGPLPPSLMAKAFSSPQPSSGAVARLIGKASNGDSPEKSAEDEEDANNAPLGVDLDDDTDINPPPPVVYPANKYIQPGAMPAEDEIWHSAENMAGNDTEQPGIKQPDMLEELGLPPPEPKPRQSKHESALIVNVVIGIGNKPYVRGTGPGLNPDIGIPMEYVGIGRWRWLSPDHTTPAEITVWKNDILRAKGDPIILPAGSTVEASPAFPED